ncbi:nucleoside-diphosphate-sugar epimerase [Pantoea ananatis]|nr:nucleoside-diphosphate-sugar epimerase [Pantoea ananatis]
MKQGLVTSLIETARQKGVSAWVGEGQNRWSAVHISDASRLYVLALEKNLAGRRYHAVAEEGIPLRSIAETIGQVLDVPVVRIEASEASAHFGALSKFVAEDMSASAAITRRDLGWKPQGPGLLADLEQVRLR